MTTPTPVTPAIPVDYTAKDFSSMRQSMLTYAQQVIPEWTTQSPADFGVAIVESVAYLVDILSYYQDRLVAEAYLSTATQRSSVLEIAQALGYIPYPAVAATGSVTFVSDGSQNSTTDVPVGTQLITSYQTTSQGPLIFETQADCQVPPNGGTATVLVVEGATQGSQELVLVPANASPEIIPVIDLGLSTGAMDQAYALPITPVDQSTVRVFLNYPGGPVEWTVTSSLLDAGPNDMVFSMATDANGIVTILFGDGVNGSIPPSGIDINAAYRVGGGVRGNLAANALVDIASPIPGVAVQSSSTMTGGSDAESTASIRRNAPAAFSTQDRAVTTSDYANLALTNAGVDKANALTQSVSVVTVYILGAANAAPSQTLIESTTKAVQTQAMAGTTVVVQGGTLIPVNFGTATSPVTVGVMPQYRRTDTQLAVTQALQNLLDPSITTFQERLTIADAYTAVASLPGVLYVQIPVMARSDQGQTGTADIVCREWEVPIAGNINITAVGGV